MSTLGGAGCGQLGRNGQLDKGPTPSSTLGIFKVLCVGQEWLRAGLLTPGLAAGCQNTLRNRKLASRNLTVMILDIPAVSV